MATVDREKVCTECLTNPKRQRKGKKFPLCDDCRKIVTARRWKARSLKRTLIEGQLVQFNLGDGWKTGYLIKFRETRADVQPIGAIGRIPDVIGVNIDSMKPEPNPSKLWPTVDDFYRASKRSAPVVLVADPTAINKSRAAEVKRGGPLVDWSPAASKAAPKPTAVKMPRAPKADSAARTAHDAEVFALKNSTKLTYTQLDLQIYGKITHGNLSWAAYKREAARVGGQS